MAARPNGKNRFKLIVVDDDIEVAEVVARYGRKMGLDVAVVDDQVAFVNHLRNQGPPAFPAILVLDIVMPRCDGIEILQLLADCKCRIPLLLMSGYTQSYLNWAEAIATAKGLIVAGTLRKPFRLSDLRRLLWAAMARWPRIRTPESAIPAGA